MDIQFKRETLFERFGLSTRLTKNELLRQFQTRPELRKELPVFIQIINNDQKLYIEELFTCCLNGRTYSVEEYLQELKAPKEAEGINNTISYRRKLSALVDAIRRFDEIVSVLKISGKVFDELLLSVLHYDEIKLELQYARVDATGEIFSDFCESLWRELEVSISSHANGLNSKTANSTYRILNAISSTHLKKRFVNSFVDATTSNLDSISARLDDEILFSSSVDFVCGLNASLFKNVDFYHSYKAFCNQLADNIDQNATPFLKHFEKLIERLHKEDAEYLCNTFVNLCFPYILFDNIEKNTYINLKKMRAASDVVQYIEDNDIECENVDIIKVLAALIENGEEWYSSYRQRIISIKTGNYLSHDLYELICLIYRSDYLRNYRILFTNLIVSLTHFDNVTEDLFSRLNKELEIISNQGAGSLGIYVIEKWQEELKNYILKYYAITILQGELVKTFDECYKLLTTDSYTAKSYMKKCDAVRGASRVYEKTLEDAKNQARSSASYQRQSYSSGGCYIATCVYGSYDCPQVWTLRRYRDDTLGSTWYGRLFIRTYYAISPTLVKWFGKTNWFKKLWKCKLDRMVAKLQNNGVEDTPYEDKEWQK